MSEIASEVPGYGKYEMPEEGADPMTKLSRAISGLLKFLTHSKGMKGLRTNFQMVFCW